MKRILIKSYDGEEMVLVGTVTFDNETVTSDEGARRMIDPPIARVGRIGGRVDVDEPEAFMHAVLAMFQQATYVSAELE